MAQQLAGTNFPECRLSFVGGQNLAIGREGHGRDDPKLIVLEWFHEPAFQLSSLSIPEAQVPVVTAGGDQPPIRRKSHARNLAPMTQPNCTYAGNSAGRERVAVKVIASLFFNSRLGVRSVALWARIRGAFPIIRFCRSL